LKAFCSFGAYFGDAGLAALNQKNSGLTALKQLLIIHAHRQPASFSQPEPQTPFAVISWWAKKLLSPGLMAVEIYFLSIIRYF
jgi:hypothetical protein